MAGRKTIAYERFDFSDFFVMLNSFQHPSCSTTGAVSFMRQMPQGRSQTEAAGWAEKWILKQVQDDGI